MLLFDDPQLQLLSSQKSLMIIFCVQKDVGLIDDLHYLN